MMEFYGLNPETHHTEVIDPDEPIRKKQKRRNKKTLKAQKKSQSFVEEDSDSEVVLSDMELNDQNEDPTTTTEASTTTTPSGPASTSTPTSTTTSKKAKKIMKTNLKPSKFLGDDSDDCETSSMDGLSESELLNRYGSDIDEDQDKTDSTGTVDNSVVNFKVPGKTVQDYTYDDTIPEHLIDNNNTTNKSLTFGPYGSIEED